MVKLKDPKLVREVYFAQGTTRDIGLRYGISRTAVSNIKRNKSWKGVNRDVKD